MNATQLKNIVAAIFKTRNEKPAIGTKQEQKKNAREGIRELAKMIRAQG